MTTNLLPLPKARFFDASGAPLAGGKVFTYEPGTTTPKSTYIDSTGNTANANPIILDSKGEANIWLSGSYKIVLKDASDITQWAVDNVSAAQPQSAILLALANATIASAKTNNYTIVESDRECTIQFDCSAGALTGTLPAASTVGANWRVSLRKADFSKNAVTINASGSDQIDYPGPEFNVTGATDNGLGLIRLTIDEQRVITTDVKVLVENVGGVSAANGVFAATRIGLTTIDLQGSTFSGTYTGGGTVKVIRTSLKLRAQSSFVDLVSDGSRWLIESGSLETLGPRDVLIGHNTGYDGFDTNNSTARPIDFWYDAAKLRLHLRTVLLTEVDDPSELALRRVDVTGSSTYPDGPNLAGVPSGSTLGMIHWTGAVSSNYTFSSRSAQIYARAAEDITTTAAGGKLIFATTPLGTAAGTADAAEIDASQNVHLGGAFGNQSFTAEKVSSAVNYLAVAGSASTGPVVVAAKGSATNLNLEFRSKGDGAIDLFTNGGSQLQFRVHHTASANRAVTATGSNNGNPQISTTGGDLSVGTPFVLKAYPKTGLPSASDHAGAIVYVSDGANNKYLAISNGTNWYYADGTRVI